MTRYWGGVLCNSPRTREAVHSWFKLLIPDDWGLPLKCDCQEDEATGRETAMRALYRTPDGRLKEALRRMGARNWTLKVQNASPGILKDWRPRPADSEASSGQVSGGTQ